jgi:heterodisulfide reductase subunit A-like polyferredoxin
MSIETQTTATAVTEPATATDAEGGAEPVRPGLIMCVCTGKCPGFEKMDIWDFINRVRIELPVEFGMIHPQLCEEDGDRFLADFLQARRPLVIAACAPNMQYKMFRDAFGAEGMDVKKDMVPLDIRDMTTDEAVDKVAGALRAMGLDVDEDGGAVDG